MAEKNKKYYFEIMRIFATALVIFNHLPGYTLYQITSGPKQWFYMFFTMITRINVPLFFMISGALLLEKTEDYKKVLEKRLPRYLVLMIVFAAISVSSYKIRALCQGNEYFISIKSFILGLFSGNLDGTFHHWYLYSYLGFLLTLPLLQRIAKGINTQDFWVLVILHGIFSSIIPMLNILLSINNMSTVIISEHFFIPLATAKSFFYPLVGYYLDKKVDVSKFKVKDILGMLIIGFLGVILSCICTYWEGSTTGTYTQNYVQLFDYVTTIIAFLIIKYIFTEIIRLSSTGKMQDVICYIGSLTLGIYLLEPIFKLFLWEWYHNTIECLVPRLIGSMIWLIGVMILCGTVTAILKKLPVFRKII